MNPPFHATGLYLVWFLFQGLFCTSFSSVGADNLPYCGSSPYITLVSEGVWLCLCVSACRSPSVIFCYLCDPCYVSVLGSLVLMAPVGCAAAYSTFGGLVCRVTPWSLRVNLPDRRSPWNPVSPFFLARFDGRDFNACLMASLISPVLLSLY